MTIVVPDKFVSKTANVKCMIRSNAANILNFFPEETFLADKCNLNKYD